MRALVQRVSQAAVDVEGERVAQIGRAMPRRPPGERAEPLYDRFCERLGAKQGIFGARISVALVNDGPVTLMVEA